MTTHAGKFDLDREFWPGQGLERLVDVSTAIRWFETSCLDSSVTDWRFETLTHGDTIRQYDTLDLLRKARGKISGVFFYGLLNDCEVTLAVTRGYVAVDVLGGGVEEDVFVSNAMDALAGLVPFGSMRLALDDDAGNANCANAGFIANLGSRLFDQHSPVMYFDELHVRSLDLAVLDKVNGVTELAGDFGTVLRVEVAPVRENPPAARDLAFELLAPVRVDRIPVWPIYFEYVRSTSLSSIEAALVVLVDDYDRSHPLPEWHPDACVRSGECTGEEWEAMFDDHLRLNSEVLERAKTVEFPAIKTD